MLLKPKYQKRPEISEADLKKRWDKKKEQIEVLANNMRKLRYNVSTDLKSDKEKDFLKALVVSTMLSTGERIGNSESAGNGHFGITWFRKKHVKIDGNKISLKYVGKSGVDHERSFSDAKLAEALKKAIATSPNQFIFTTSDGFRVKADSVNRYLSDFDIRSKDIRGYSSNRWMLDKLKTVQLPDKDTEEKNERERKKLFMKTLRHIAQKVGHGSGTLRNHYLIPELESSFVKKGTVIDINDRDTYEDGGVVEERKATIDKEQRVKNFLNSDNNIDSKELRIILGYSPAYPVQVVGNIKLRKVFLKPYYKKIN
jgi:hypothetical protein